ncbi:hypothetical protein T439DRAFT_76056 [Meredithblackwellia eburnea MCA 4105]
MIPPGSSASTSVPTLKTTTRSESSEGDMEGPFSAASWSRTVNRAPDDDLSERQRGKRKETHHELYEDEGRTNVAVTENGFDKGKKRDRERSRTSSNEHTFSLEIQSFKRVRRPSPSPSPSTPSPATPAWSPSPSDLPPPLFRPPSPSSTDEASSPPPSSVSSSTSYGVKQEPDASPPAESLLSNPRRALSPSITLPYSSTIPDVVLYHLSPSPAPTFLPVEGLLDHPPPVPPSLDHLGIIRNPLGWSDVLPWIESGKLKKRREETMREEASDAAMSALSRSSTPQSSTFQSDAITSANDTRPASTHAATLRVIPPLSGSLIVFPPVPQHSRSPSPAPTRPTDPSAVVWPAMAPPNLNPLDHNYRSLFPERATPGELCRYLEKSAIYDRCRGRFDRAWEFGEECPDLNEGETEQCRVGYGWFVYSRKRWKLELKVKRERSGAGGGGKKERVGRIPPPSLRRAPVRTRWALAGPHAPLVAPEWTGAEWTPYPPSNPSVEEKDAAGGDVTLTGDCLRRWAVQNWRMWDVEDEEEDDDEDEDEDETEETYYVDATPELSNGNANQSETTMPPPPPPSLMPPPRRAPSFVIPIDIISPTTTSSFSSHSPSSRLSPLPPPPESVPSRDFTLFGSVLRDPMKLAAALEAAVADSDDDEEEEEAKKSEVDTTPSVIVSTDVEVQSEALEPAEEEVGDGSGERADSHAGERPRAETLDMEWWDFVFS